MEADRTVSYLFSGRRPGQSRPTSRAGGGLAAREHLTDLVDRPPAVVQRREQRDQVRKNNVS
jgi:hypothetical protein